MKNKEPDEMMEAAKQYGKALEINASFERLDLDDIHCRKAKEMGISLAIGTQELAVEVPVIVSQQSQSPELLALDLESRLFRYDEV